jgi:hypothetical protein
MAKRVKMNPEVVMEQVMHLHHLLEVPEAGKLRKLDTEMSKLAEDSSMKPEEKIRLFEELLAEYRQMLEVLKKKGSTNVLDEESGQVLRNLIKAMVKDEQEKMIQEKEIKVELKAGKQEDTEDEELDETSSSTPKAVAIPMDTTHGSVESLDYATPKYETPTNARGRKSGTKSLQKILTSALKSRGALFCEEGVKIPLGKSSSKSGKKRPRVALYKQTTFDNMLEYLAATSDANPRGNMGRILDVVLDAVKSDIDDDMMLKYPNLRRAYEDRFPSLNGSWSTV